MFSHMLKSVNSRKGTIGRPTKNNVVITKRTHVLHRMDGTAITTTYGTTETIPTYPSDGILGLGDMKPILHIMGGTTTIETLNGHIYEALQNPEPISVRLVNRFLHLYLDSITPVPCPQEWTSFGIRICEQGSLIGPSGLYDVRIDLAAIELPAVVAPLSNLALALLLFGSYRITNANERQRDDLLTRLSEHFRIYSDGNAFPTTLAVHGSVLANDENFKVLSAAFDMHNLKFNQAPESILRFGTVVSCFKDSSALLSVCFAEDQIFGKRYGIGRWVLNRTLADEYLRIVKEDEEMRILGSYSTYAVDFNLVRKSPYSATVNKSIHVLVNVVGTFLQHTRCIHSRMLDCSDMTAVLNNGLFIAYSLGKSSSLERFYAPEFEDQLEAPINEENRMEGGRHDDEPAQVDPDLWIKWFALREYKPTARMLKYARSQVSTLSQLRSGTIGEFVKNRFLHLSD